LIKELVKSEELNVLTDKEEFLLINALLAHGTQKLVHKALLVWHAQLGKSSQEWETAQCAQLVK